MTYTDWNPVVSTGTIEATDVNTPTMVQYEMEFIGVGVRVWTTTTGENSGSTLFAQAEMPLVGVTINSGGDERQFSESGSHGIVLREGATAADEQYSWNVDWDAAVSAWRIDVVLGGAIQDAVSGTAEVPQDDGRRRTVIVTVVGPPSAEIGGE